MIPKSFIEEVNARVDLVQFIGQRLPELKKAGHDYTACCPFHSESSPSFTVSPKKGFYHCFGCGKHGEAINFIMEYEGLKFIEALKVVAESVGMELPKDDRPERTKEEKQEAARFMKALDVLTDVSLGYSALLQESPDAMGYLINRGVSHESIQRFGLGFAPDAWNTITGKKQFSREALQDAGLTAKREGKDSVYDRFRDRIMFPIYGKKDAVIGFGGRAIHGQDPKYLNSPECIVFHKGDNLYGVKQAEPAIRAANRVFVVEGYMDVIIVSQFAVENVLAALGTSVTEKQMRKLFRLAARVTFCMDGDEPGRNAAWRAAENILPLLDDSHQVDFMFMPDNMDPDEFVRAFGKEKFEELAGQARSLTDYMMDVLVRETDMQNGESLARYLTEANKQAEKICSGVLKLSFQKRIAELAGISLDTMLGMLKEQKVKVEAHQAARVVKVATPQPIASQGVAAEPVRPQVVPIAPHAAPEVSIAAKMLGITALHTREVAEKLNTDFLARFLNTADREMLFPLLAYLKVNPTAIGESVVASLSFNPYIALISALVNSADLMGSEFDARAEARAILERFKMMEKAWAVVLSSQKKTAA